MEPQEMLANCNRIAAILNDPRKYVAAHVMSGITPSIASSVNIATKRFTAPTWEEMFRQAEAYAHELVAERNAADIEYRSWIEPHLPLAIAAE